MKEAEIAAFVPQSDTGMRVVEPFFVRGYSDDITCLELRLNRFDIFLRNIIMFYRINGLLTLSDFGNEGGVADERRVILRVLGHKRHFKRKFHAAKLAGGIWEALICTGVGLSMAIPFAVLHSLLESRLNHIVAGVEDVIARVFTTELDVAAGDAGKRA